MRTLVLFLRRAPRVMVVDMSIGLAGFAGTGARDQRLEGVACTTPRFRVAQQAPRMVVAEEDRVKLEREEVGIDVGAKVTLLDRHAHRARECLGPQTLRVHEGITGAASWSSSSTAPP